jgi:serine/threonine-protein kinase RsbW
MGADSVAAARGGERVEANSARVRVVNGPLVAPVLGRVVAMLAARAECPVDRLDDALLVVDTLAAHCAEHVPDGRVTMNVHSHAGELVLRLGPLVAPGGQTVLERAAIPGVGNVLERVADSVAVEDADDGTQALRVSLSFPVGASAPAGGG